MTDATSSASDRSGLAASSTEATRSTVRSPPSTLVWDESLASLKPGGRLVITGTTAGSQIPFDLRLLQSRPLTLMGCGGRSRRSFAAMMHVVRYGGLRGVVGKTFELADAARAHEVMAGRDVFGKLVLRVP
jgi:NADPH:quinone reductase-like Zn-dependent oxidoreductase